MSLEVTLTLSDPKAHHLEQFGKKVRRPLEAILTESLELLWPMPELTALTH